MQFLKTKKEKIVAGVTAIAIALAGGLLWSVTRQPDAATDIENATEELNDNLEALKEKQRRREAERQN